MLTQFVIRDFAIIDRMELDLDAGLSVLSGETGAGKSILVDALGLVLGDRADADVIRQGAERAEISAEFDIGKLPSVRAWLDAHELAADGACILRRVLGRDGRARGQINGRSVPLQLLRELGEQLVDIHGQHEHQSLLKSAAQLVLLDEFADQPALLARVAGLYRDWKTAHERLTALRAAARNRDTHLELLSHQVSELDALGLQPGEIAALNEEHRRLANSSKLMEGAQTALHAVYESEEASAHQLTHQALAALSALGELDVRLQPVSNLLNNAEIQLTEAGETLRRYLADTDLDPQRLDQIENRLGAIHDVARKHHLEPEALPVLLEKLRVELHAVENAEVALQELELELARLRDAYREASTQLSRERGQTAARLGTRTTGIMRELGMPGGRFAIQVNTDAERLSPHGSDAVEFQVSANPGQPLKALARVASGGELSRIALAIQVVAARASAVPCMIFDEVDAGIGGGVAEIVGRYLRSLGVHRQVLCVTHLPQVASQAHRHFRVLKQAHGQTTSVRIDLLDRKSRIEELARMLGGVEITATTRKHASEMIARAGNS
ncbi:MAG: DNA repair protein RecN [Gammaproteobacteria bacterium]